MRLLSAAMGLAILGLVVPCGTAASASPRRPGGAGTNLPFNFYRFYGGSGSRTIASRYDEGAMALGTDSQILRPNNVSGGNINFTYSGGTSTFDPPTAKTGSASNVFKINGARSSTIGTGGTTGNTTGDTTSGGTVSGGTITGGTTSGGTTTGGSATLAESPSVQAQRLYRYATVPASLPEPVKQAAVKAQQALAGAPQSARNYTMSLFNSPASPAQLQQAVKASKVLAEMSSPDVHKVFEVPVRGTDADKAAFYRSRIDQLASRNAYRLSGDKAVVVVAKPRAGASSFDSLRQKARKSVRLGSRNADSVIAACLAGKENSQELRGFSEDMQRALARDTSQLWLAGGASSELAQTVSLLGAPKSAASSAYGKLTVIATQDATVTPLRTGDGGQGYVQDGQKRLAQVSGDHAASPTQAVVSEIHPNGLIATVSDPVEAEKVIGQVESNPWYQDQASVSLLVESHEGSELLIF